ncbi:hypothetical protein [Actinoplanes teichomyceticus]|uniref:Uncharacterized protein n=1 Tax=Actinoplanes teichomyceticus TaxID=1867 RepID=A0A561VMT4_ACTTI|nr:hypothetical protein [Actinoplanes teichomyceticus]TWG12913.1 hypothetical protein FHX34_105781 [Actinoplanes teichomyceticus]GIF13666.1 hypothetical protein Ate01nite_36980 [Actinoplanes teichomyceticus]
MHTGATGVIRSYQVLDGGTGAVLAGSGAGVVPFPATALTELTFRITAASGTPRVAEFETYAA